MGDYEAVRATNTIGSEHPLTASLNEVSGINFVVRGGELEVDLPQSLETWLTNLFEEITPEILRKAAKYGERELQVMGESLRRELKPSPSMAIQISAASYAQGKVARALAAIERGESPDRDTWFDLFVYGLIGLRAAEQGTWSGTSIPTL